MKFLTLQEVADMLKVCPRTVTRKPIRFTKVGSLRRYDIRDVEKYLNSRASRKAAA